MAVESADLEKGVNPPNLDTLQTQQHVSIISVNEEGDVKVQKDSVITAAEVVNENVQNGGSEVLTASDNVETTRADSRVSQTSGRADSRVSQTSGSQDASSHGGDTASTLSGGEVNLAFQPDAAAVSSPHTKTHTRQSSSSPISQVLVILF